MNPHFNKTLRPIAAHRFKIQGRGYLMFLPKSLGVKVFRKNYQGVPVFWV
jgi:hypothetical protein